MPRVLLAYGGGPDQVGDLWLPSTPPPYPVVVLVHGGFWYQRWQRDLMDRLAQDLARRGRAAWNIEYRRVGGGGGWPATGQDVARAVDHLATMSPVHGLDLNQVTLVGHSAGGHLALWASARREASVRAVLVVGLAPVTDLALARAEGLGSGAVDALFAGGPTQTNASPIHRLPLGLPQLLAHAADDSLVPVAHTRRYVSAARSAGDSVDYRETPSGGHFTFLDPDSEVWAEVVAALPQCQH
jgi:acetyl esterase/lipase